VYNSDVFTFCHLFLFPTYEYIYPSNYSLCILAELLYDGYYFFATIFILPVFEATWIIIILLNLEFISQGF